MTFQKYVIDPNLGNLIIVIPKKRNNCYNVADNYQYFPWNTFIKIKHELFDWMFEL